MKFSYTHKVFSIALSFLVLFSTLSLTIEKHFCGDTLIDVAIFSEAEICGMQDIKMDQDGMMEKSCCKNEKEVIDGVNKLVTKSFDDFHDLQKLVLIAYSYSYINLFEELPNAVIPHKNYSPPKLIKDIYVLDETYLI
ncbi:HYC_CC_PP family protein [Winogradskyella undariae]|uniref:HYC_CC_PP family protein n=1 Tax=Winogradskyella undariae TaxID=1285465 RepID=UPI0015CDFB23|nr:hypothetical protein [Winogradskyella undariae]